MKKLLTLSLLFLSSIAMAQFWENTSINGGLRIQKTQNLYWENGFSFDFSNKTICNEKLHAKFSYVTSRLGSAMVGNAIKQDNYILGFDWRFLSEKAFTIYTGINTGFFHADMEEEMFEDLPHNSMLLSLEFGVSYRFTFPLNVSLGLGYNLINGDGINAPGTLFPVFYQMSLFYRLKN